MENNMDVQNSYPDRDVPTRRISFEESLGDIPRHFALDGDLILSHFAAVLSAFFPDGEDYFVRSVRYFRDELTDPKLKRQVAGFIGQEATHGREHRALNEHLARIGYPTKRIERMTRTLLIFRERLLTANSNLATTAALEHFTATLAEQILSDPDARAMVGHEAMRNLFLWHALEEAEHKAVAFDVYRAVGGSERTRVLTMKVIRAAFLIDLLVQTAISLLLDPATYRDGNLWRSLRRLRRSPLLTRRMWGRLREYDAPTFHPDDRDMTQLIDRWRTELFGHHGTLNDNLVKTAAS
jgi:predicted metal-dependent hydrolase